MKFVDPGPLADPAAAARKLLELAYAFEPVQDGRIYIEKINGPFLRLGIGTQISMLAIVGAGHPEVYGTVCLP